MYSEEDDKLMDTIIHATDKDAVYTIAHVKDIAHAYHMMRIDHMRESLDRSDAANLNDEYVVGYFDAKNQHDISEN